MRLHVIAAIFKRNLYSYFANPIGYIFVCAFVLLAGGAAFGPHEFFNANLANLDQLNKVMPLILLLFIPAITLSLWAEERQQGTDELLLTIPADDLEVVLGKYLAAAAIFTVSLVFSLTNLVVLHVLGSPDLGLMLVTYLGYWVVGMAMLSVGMVASFLTNNLTIAFLLGVAFNAPLVLAGYADTVVGDQAWANRVEAWSVGAKFVDFSRGVVSFSSLAYFLCVVVAMLYLSMVLIGKRHWSTGAGGENRGLHYLVRAACVLAAAFGLCAVLNLNDVRVDASSERLSSLSPKTLDLLAHLDAKRRVRIEAFISPEAEMPETYIPTRLNLLSMLDELQKRGKGRIEVLIHETDSYKPEASVAEQRFGITGQRIFARDKGKYRETQVYMGVAVLSGDDRQVIPFVDRGVPAEYELVRSIVTLAGQSVTAPEAVKAADKPDDAGKKPGKGAELAVARRRKLGLVQTEVRMAGGFNQQAMQPIPAEAVYTELQKQYDIRDVNLGSPLAETYDALLVFQPSSLDATALAHLALAIKDGVPTVIFEDPAPFLDRSTSGTTQPRRSQGNPMMAPPPREKADASGLWKLLGVEFAGRGKPGDILIRQTFNPFPKADHFPEEFVFIGEGSGQSEPVSRTSAITSGLRTLMFLAPGAVIKKEESKLAFEPLVRTGKSTGTLPANALFQDSPFGPGGINAEREKEIDPTAREYVLAAHITGDAPAPAATAPKDGKDNADGKDNKDSKDAPAPAKKKINVVLVADLDVASSVFFNIRNQGENPDVDLYLDVDNVAFVLNCVDVASGDDRFVEIRKHKRVHRPLSVFEKMTNDAQQKTIAAKDKFRKDFDARIEKYEKDLKKQVDEINASNTGDDNQAVRQFLTAQEQISKKVDAERARMTKLRDEDIKKVENQLQQEIAGTQNMVKRVAILVPPLVPLAIACVVFLVRRSRELEGAPRGRLA